MPYRLDKDNLCVYLKLDISLIRSKKDVMFGISNSVGHADIMTKQEYRTRFTYDLVSQLLVHRLKVVG